MNLETLKELYVEELRDLFNAENQLIKALPKMAKGASSDELKEAFEKHLEQTKGHVQRLEQVFEELGEKTKGKTCQAMKGLIEEGSEVLKADGEDSVSTPQSLWLRRKSSTTRSPATAVCAPLRNCLDRTNPRSFSKKLWMRKKRQTNC